MDTNTQHKRDQLVQLVSLTRRRLRQNAVWTGVALLVLAATVWLTLCMAVDLLIALPVALRVAAWAGLWLIVASAALLLVLWPALRPMKLVQVAFRIERVLGDMHNRLVTVVDLRQRFGDTHKSDAATASFVQRLIDQTSERLANYRVQRVANHATALRLTTLAAVVLLSVAAVTVVFHERTANALQRIAQPTAAIPPVAWVALSPSPAMRKCCKANR